MLDTLQPISYVDLNGMLDAAFPKGALNYWKSHFLDRLADEAIDALIDQFSRCPTPMGPLMLEHSTARRPVRPQPAAAAADQAEVRSRRMCSA